MPSKEKNVVITSAVRTAIGTFRGSLKDMQAHDLGALTTKAAMEKSNLNEGIFSFTIFIYTLLTFLIIV